MHQHYEDMFETSEFGVRFRVYGRIDEVGGPATLAAPAPAKAPAPAAPAAVAKPAAKISDLEAEKSAKAVQPAAEKPKTASVQAQEGAAKLGTPPQPSVGAPKGAPVGLPGSKAAAPVAPKADPAVPSKPSHSTTPSKPAASPTTGQEAFRLEKQAEARAATLAAGPNGPVQQPAPRSRAMEDTRRWLQEMAAQPNLPTNAREREFAASVLKKLDAAEAAWIQR